MALVLCTGVNPQLMKTRKLLLEQAGHKVITASDERTVDNACQKHTFDVAVIGQDISRRIKPLLLNLIRELCDTTRVLELYSSSIGRILDGADDWLEVPTDSPADLAAKVGVLARRKRSAAS
jgi:DNA-binding response OmpR family regulator